DLFERLSDDVCQNIQPAPVGHADDRFLDVVQRGFGQNPLQYRDGSLCPFQAESLVPDEPGVKKPLKPLGRREAAENLPLGFCVQRRPIFRRLHTLLNPALFFRVLNVAVFDADLLTISLAQHGKDLPERAARESPEAPCNKLPVQIPDSQTIGSRVQIRMVESVLAQRVQVRNEMSAHPVEIDELEHAGLLFQFILCQRSSEPGGALVQRQRFVRQSQILEDALVESIMSEEQL